MVWASLYGRGWTPWLELERLQREMNRVFDAAGEGRTAEFPAVNIWTGDDKVLLTAEIPGIDPAKLEVTVKNDTVTIRGSREAEEPKKGQVCLRQERGAGSFVRSFALPMQVDAEHVQAHYQKGVLQLTLPRAEADRPKKIAVTTG